jgi:hypothetical protein
MLVKVFLFQLARIIHALSGLGLGYKTELQNARNTDLFTKQSGPKGPGFGLPPKGASMVFPPCGSLLE